MNQEEIYNQVEKIAKDNKIMEKHYGVESFGEDEPYFTTSQYTDVWEMIRDGMTVEEIITIMRQW